MKTALELKATKVSELPLQGASWSIWDTKYRLKSKSGQPVDRDIQGTYERSSIVETLKTIRQKHDESLWDYVKHFCNARNVIPYIHHIEIINAFRNEVSDIKTVE